MVQIEDISTPVVILRAVGHGPLGILRTLGRLRVPVYVVEADPWSPAYFSRYCKGKFLFDVENVTPAKAVAYLLEVARKIGRRSILIPTTDEVAILVAENTDLLEQGFIFPRAHAGLVSSLCNKKEMHFLAKRCGIPTPEIVFPQSTDDVLRFIETATFPVMFKGIDGLRLLKYTGKRMFIVRTGTELLEKYGQISEDERSNVMLQEYIPGGDDTVWMFNGYFDESSYCQVGFTGKKLRQCPVHRGVTSLGICLRNERVEKTTKEFMKAVGYRGILDIGYKYDVRDDCYKVLDINPRIGATFRLFVDGNGMDVARSLYLDLTGQPVIPSVPVVGRKWIVEDLDIVSCFRYGRGGELTFREWARSYRGIQETAYFAPDDPLPLLPMFRNDCADAFGRILNRVGFGRTKVPESSPEGVTVGNSDRQSFEGSALPVPRLTEAGGQTSLESTSAFFD